MLFQPLLLSLHEVEDSSLGFLPGILPAFGKKSFQHVGEPFRRLSPRLGGAELMPSLVSWSVISAIRLTPFSAEPTRSMWFPTLRDGCCGFPKDCAFEHLTKRSPSSFGPDIFLRKWKKAVDETYDRDEDDDHLL
jgi:hypothetical protein